MVWTGPNATIDVQGLIQKIPAEAATQQEAVDLINEGGSVTRVDPPHAAPNPHNFPHINYYTSSGTKGTIEIIPLK
jgi:hypothetical protein